MPKKTFQAILPKAVGLPGQEEPRGQPGCPACEINVTNHWDGTVKLRLKPPRDRGRAGSASLSQCFLGPEAGPGHLPRPGGKTCFIRHDVGLGRCPGYSPSHPSSLDHHWTSLIGWVAELIKGPPQNKSTILAADASRRAALLVAYIRRVCALHAPCRAGASTPKMIDLFCDGP